MTEPVFVAESARLLIAAGTGIILLLLLIIKFKIHPILSLLISALVIGLGAGMPVPTPGKYSGKRCGGYLAGNYPINWTWLFVWRNPGSIRRCTMCCPDFDQ